MMMMMMQQYNSKSITIIIVALFTTWILLIGNEMTSCTAFVVNREPANSASSRIGRQQKHQKQYHSQSSLMIQHLSPVDITDAITSNTLWIATIDADIANIDDNEFRPIFMGGILVMFGGLISALIVGYIVESRNLYATLVADSYAQGGTGNDGEEEFWKGLSEEEKKKAQELLRKVKEANEGGGGKSSKETVTATTITNVSPTLQTKIVESVPTLSSSNGGKEKKEIGMFSDYGE